MEKIQVDGDSVSFGEQGISHDVKDELLEAFKNEVSSAVSKPFLGFDPNEFSE